MRIEAQTDNLRIVSNSLSDSSRVYRIEFRPFGSKAWTEMAEAENEAMASACYDQLRSALAASGDPCWATDRLAVA